MRTTVTICFALALMQNQGSAAAQAPMAPSQSMHVQPNDPSRFDPLKVKWLLERSGCIQSMSVAGINGIVSVSVDMTDDRTAAQYVQSGIAFGREQCPSMNMIQVHLRPGTPATFADPESGFEWMHQGTHPNDEVAAQWYKTNPDSIVRYRNWPKAMRAQVASTGRSPAPAAGSGGPAQQPRRGIVVPPGQPAGGKSNTGIYLGYFGATNVAMPYAAPPPVDPAKVKFLSNGQCSVGFGNTVDQHVSGMVAPELDISTDAVAQQLIRSGFAFGRAQCPPHGENFQGVLRGRTVSVILRQGDRATFKASDIRTLFYSEGSLWDQPVELVYGTWVDSDSGTIRGYRNAPKALLISRAYDAQEQQKKNDIAEGQAEAAHAQQDRIAAQVAAFVKANGVSRLVTAEQLAANPFVYQGKVVAIYGEFQQMTSATQGIFSAQDKTFVVSGIPMGRFTQQGSMVMVAGRVLGNTEIKLPILGPTLVPNVAFVGSAFCQQFRCADYPIR